MSIQEKLAHHLAALAPLGTDENGAQRLAFTDEERLVVDYFRGQMDELGLEIQMDAFGNLYALLPGSDPQAAAVLAGSHADSVPNGGCYDGIVGLLCALEAVREMSARGEVLRAPVGILLFRNEESARFGAATLGSRAAIGELTLAQAEALRDKAGISLAQALRAEGLHPEALGKPLLPFPVAAFCEVHIEQGRVLEDAGLPLGIVTSIAAATRTRLVLTGRADHSGATPMNLRNDALCAAAECILALEKLAARAEPIPVVGTVGIIEAVPGVMNVIPGTVTLGVDIRSADAEAKAQITAQFLDACEAICRAREISLEIIPLSNETPVPLPNTVRDLFEKHAAALGIPRMRLPSGAGHDSMYMAQVAPTGMLFVPCRDGRSHCREEFAAVEDIATATRVLTETMVDLAK